MRYWLTPPELYARLDSEFHFDFDPCPYPRPEGYNSLQLPWGKMSYCNPPYEKKDGNTHSLTPFVRKAISEKARGNSTVLLLPSRTWINALLEAGVELRPAGRVKFLEADTLQPWRSPSSNLIAILHGSPP